MSRFRERLADMNPVLRALLGLVAFTVGVCLAVAGSVAIMYGTLLVGSSVTTSTRLASLLALVLFAAVIAIPSYLLVRRSSGEGAANEDGEQSR